MYPLCGVLFLIVPLCGDSRFRLGSVARFPLCGMHKDDDCEIHSLAAQEFRSAFYGSLPDGTGHFWNLPELRVALQDELLCQWCAKKPVRAKDV